MPNPIFTLYTKDRTKDDGTPIDAVEQEVEGFQMLPFALVLFADKNTTHLFPWAELKQVSVYAEVDEEEEAPGEVDVDPETGEVFRVDFGKSDEPTES